MAVNVWPLDTFINVPMQSSPAILNQNHDFESGVTPWTGGNNASISQSGLWSFNGSDSALFTGDGVTASPEIVSEKIPVTAGLTYTFSSEMYSPQGWAAGVGIVINWFTAAGGFISTSVGSFSALPANVLAGSLISFTVAAVANAGLAVMMVQAGGTPGVGVQFFSDMTQANPGSVISNGLGSAIASVGPGMVREHWQPGSAFVGATTNVNEASCNLYMGSNVQSGTLLAHTSKASSGSTAPLSGDMPTGYRIWAVWTGGDAGPLVQATLRVTGSRSNGIPQ